MGTNNFRRDGFFKNFFVFKNENIDESTFNDLRDEINRMNDNLRYIRCEIKDGYHQGFELTFWNCKDFNMTERSLTDFVERISYNTWWVTDAISGMTKDDINEIKSITSTLKTDYDLIFKKIEKWHENGWVNIGEQYNWIGFEIFSIKQFTELLVTEKQNVEKIIDNLNVDINEYLDNFEEFKKNKDDLIEELSADEKFIKYFLENNEFLYGDIVAWNLNCGCKNLREVCDYMKDNFNEDCKVYSYYGNYLRNKGFVENEIFNLMNYQNEIREKIDNLCDNKNILTIIPNQKKLIEFFDVDDDVIDERIFRDSGDIKDEIFELIQFIFEDEENRDWDPTEKMDSCLKKLENELQKSNKTQKTKGQ